MHSSNTAYTQKFPHIILNVCDMRKLHGISPFARYDTLPYATPILGSNSPVFRIGIACRSTLFPLEKSP
ncbi:unnamed protein product [Periconia digitata]|uniref:Uncharacterized protein n=1 Tax=Periconia digitata TaxID=1303443 RepID=A0A9W4XU22_9PLEO|nr:unnamed protein product [Periconia digitata]